MRKQLLLHVAWLSLVLSIAACGDDGTDGDEPGDVGAGDDADGGPATDGGAGAGGGGTTGGKDAGVNPGPTCLTDCPEDACGYVPNECGGFLMCDVCPAGEICGLLAPVRCDAAPAECTAIPGQCEVTSCIPKTCAVLGNTCGLTSDGCGGVVNCWPGCLESDPSCPGACGDYETCAANTEDVQSCIPGMGACTGTLCSSAPSGCAMESPTQLQGTVKTPGRLVGSAWVNQLPVPNAIVYIPAEPIAVLPTVFEGVDPNDAASCGRCEDERLVAENESVLAAAVTDFKGEFTLSGRIPVDTAFNLVIKVGKWRRVVEVPAGVAVACETHPLDLEATRLAATADDGLAGTHLPKIAVSTGDVDAMECVLRGMGIAQSEFTVPSGAGRIHMYRANGARMGSSGNNMSVNDEVLYGSQDTLNAYDMVVFDCEGEGHAVRALDDRTRILSYADAGGRVFASHWSYEWLDNTGTLDMAAAWNLADNPDPDDVPGYVSLPSGATMRSGANPIKSETYLDWLVYQGALTDTVAGQLEAPETPEIDIKDARDVAGATVGSFTDEWLYRDTGNPKVQQLSFNTPYGSAEDAICGRVAFSAFHVATAPGGGTLDTSGLYFPNECSNGELNAQEKTLAFMLFDLAACVTIGDPPAPPICDPRTGAELCPLENDACGYLSDRCGGVVDCGGCDPGFSCDGNTCREQGCTPTTCDDLGYSCGEASDDCGGLLECGDCPGGYCASNHMCVALPG
jgi:hypothetical protein